VSRRLLYGSLALSIVALALVAAGCGGKSKSGGGNKGGGNAKALSAAACAPIYFEGSGSADYLIASDLPLQGANRPLTTEMVKAIKFILKQHNFKAGKYSIGYQSCDDSTAQAGSWDSARCSSNARGYASNQSVIGVVGTFNSGCAKLEIPVLNRASNGPVGLISPANTYPGLTLGGPGTESGEPDVYYPTGKRNYARVVWTDQFQGAADGLLIKSLGLKNVFILTDKQTYGLGIAKLTQRALKKLGIGVAGFQAWDSKATSYEAIASKIKTTGADGVFLGGIVCNNGGKLLKDLRAGLGSGVTFIGPDGWTPISATIQEGGAASDGMYVTQPGIPTEQLKGAGKKFADTFGGEIGHPPDPYTAYAAQAAEVLINAISRSDGTRGDVAAKLHNVTVTNGILGNFKIDANGDTTLGTVSVNHVQGKKYPLLKTITPDLNFVKGT
jgi:branched-chain amino acid transport system substrate-binding protein